MQLSARTRERDGMNERTYPETSNNADRTACALQVENALLEVLRPDDSDQDGRGVADV